MQRRGPAEGARTPTPRVQGERSQLGGRSHGGRRHPITAGLRQPAQALAACGRSRPPADDPARSEAAIAGGHLGRLLGAPAGHRATGAERTEEGESALFDECPTANGAGRSSAPSLPVARSRNRLGWRAGGRIDSDVGFEGERVGELKMRPALGETNSRSSPSNSA